MPPIFTWNIWGAWSAAFMNMLWNELLLTHALQIYIWICCFKAIHIAQIHMFSTVKCLQGQVLTLHVAEHDLTLTQALSNLMACHKAVYFCAHQDESMNARKSGDIHDPTELITLNKVLLVTTNQFPFCQEDCMAKVRTPFSKSERNSHFDFRPVWDRSCYWFQGKLLNTSH